MNCQSGHSEGVVVEGCLTGEGKIELVLGIESILGVGASTKRSCQTKKQRQGKKGWSHSLREKV